MSPILNPPAAPAGAHCEQRLSSARLGVLPEQRQVAWAVAVLLGWLFAGEKMSVSIMLSAVLAISAIGLVNSGSAESECHG